MSDAPATPAPEVVERPHAERSASQLKSLALCPGYKPDRTSGRRTHWVTEQGLRGHDALERDDKSDLESKTEEELVQLCEDYVNRLPSSVWDFREVRVETLEGRWGYIDRLRWRGQPGSPLWTATEVDLIDYKFVRKREPEDAEINLQGKDYVIGVFLQYPDVKTIHVHFLAPRFGAVTTATFSRDQLPRLKLEVLAVLTQARKTDRKHASVSLFRPDYDTCRFCGRLATCPAVTKIAKEVAEKYTRTPIPLVPEEVHASRSEDPKVLGALKMLAAILGPWAGAVDSHALQSAQDGILPDGYELAFRKGSRRVTDPEALILIARKYGVTVDELLSTAKLSLPSLEDLVADKAPRGQKGKQIISFLNDCRDADAFLRMDEVAFLQRKSA